MLEELRRFNSVGSKDGLELFLDTIFSKEDCSLDALEGVYLGVSAQELNIKAAIAVFEELKLISLNENTVSLTPKGREVSKIIPKDRNDAIARIVMEALIEEAIIDIKHIEYSRLENSIVLNRWAFPLKTAIYRNLLLNLDAIKPCQEGWIIKDNQRELIEEKVKQKRKILSQEELLKQLQKNQEDGEKAEVFVLEYEIRRLNNNAEKKPKQISQIDVSAGYDILSYSSEEMPEYDMFIEVKSFRGAPHFFWSSNERRTAELLNDNYYIYLVDSKELENKNELYEPVIIKNPFNCLSEQNWYIEPNDYKVTKVNYSSEEIFKRDSYNYSYDLAAEQDELESY